MNWFILKTPNKQNINIVILQESDTDVLCKQMEPY